MSSQDKRKSIKEAEYNEVLLGLHNKYRVPKLGSICVIGVIKEIPAVFLIEAMQTEELLLEKK